MKTETTTREITGKCFIDGNQVGEGTLVITPLSTTEPVDLFNCSEVDEVTLTFTLPLFAEDAK